jgi:hypothetical protein
MIHRYRRQARQASELALGGLCRLDAALGLASGLAHVGGPQGGPEAQVRDSAVRASGDESSQVDASAEGGTRTLKPLRTADFESAASANSATSACSPT